MILNINYCLVCILLLLIGTICGYRANHVNDRLVYRDVLPIEVRTFPNGSTIGFYPDGTPVRPIAEPRITFPSPSPTRMLKSIWKKEQTILIFHFFRFRFRLFFITIIQTIQFSDPHRSSQQPNLNIRCADGAWNGVFCSRIENYPEDHIDQLLSRNYDENLFKSDAIFPEIGVRGAELESSLCSSKRALVHPQAGYTNDNILQVIVNDDKIKQGVFVEECVNMSSPCITDKISVANGYKTECKQNFIYREMITPAVNGFEKKQFRIPSCCSCHIVPDIN